MTPSSRSPGRPKNDLAPTGGGSTHGAEPGAQLILKSTLTCPACGQVATETMPTDACQWFYECQGCGVLLSPETGDCCVFCSYGDVPCPPVQLERAGCGWGCCGA